MYYLRIVYLCTALHTQCITSVCFSLQHYCTYSVYYLSRLNLTGVLYLLHILPQYASSQSTTVCTPYIASTEFVSPALLYILRVLPQYTSSHSTTVCSQCIVSIVHLMVLLYVLSVLPQCYSFTSQCSYPCSVYYLSIHHLTSSTICTGILPWYTSSHSITVQTQCISQAYFILQYYSAYSAYYLSRVHHTTLVRILSVWPWYTSPHQLYSTYLVYYLGILKLTILLYILSRQTRDH